MAAINQVPTGLLDLLDLKQLGKNPGELSNSIVGTIDAFPMYAAFDQEMYQNQIVSAGSFTANIAVPLGEVWVPLHMSLRFTVANANDWIALGLRIGQINLNPFSNPTAPYVELATGPGGNGFMTAAPATNVGDQFSVEYTWPRLIFYPSDTNFYWRTFSAHLAGATTFINAITYYRFQV